MHALLEQHPANNRLSRHGHENAMKIAQYTPAKPTDEQTEDLSDIARQVVCDLHGQLAELSPGREPENRFFIFTEDEASFYGLPSTPTALEGAMRTLRAMLRTHVPGQVRAAATVSLYRTAHPSHAGHEQGFLVHIERPDGMGLAMSIPTTSTQEQRTIDKENTRIWCFDATAVADGGLMGFFRDESATVSEEAPATVH